MTTQLQNKSTVDEIRTRFDADVDRFANLETGQQAAIDSPLHLSLLGEAAVCSTPESRSIQDIGCGAGNYTLKLIEQMQAAGDGEVHPPRVTLIDLSRPMLDRAEHRIREAGVTDVTTLQADIREAELGELRFDIAVAGQCLHHLRGRVEWAYVFRRVWRSLTLGGGFWVSDSVDYENPAVRAVMRRRWADHLEGLRDAAYRDHVMAYVEREDSPRPLGFQLQLMRDVGFTGVDVLHVHNRFASFGGIRPPARPQRLH